MAARTDNVFVNEAVRSLREGRIVELPEGKVLDPKTHALVPLYNLNRYIPQAPTSYCPEESCDLTFGCYAGSMLGRVATVLEVVDELSKKRGIIFTKDGNVIIYEARPVQRMGDEVLDEGYCSLGFPLRGRPEREEPTRNPGLMISDLKSAGIAKRLLREHPELVR